MFIRLIVSQKMNVQSRNPPNNKKNSMKTILYTLVALFAFAANSVLVRLALAGNTIDAANFTSIRLISGIIVLAVILKIRQGLNRGNGHRSDESKRRGDSPGISIISSTGSWKASVMLFIYAITFSYAYVSLETGVGALILFASVQMTMVLTGLFLGNRLNYFEWGGVLTAFCGFVYLVMPDLGAPSLFGFVLMTISGIAWGFYTLAGKNSKTPLSDTAYNFFRTLPLVVILFALTFDYSALSYKGVMLAMLSGGLASGVGYTIWYMALRGLLAVQAAVVQLLVPIIAGIGGVIFANEVFSVHLAISSLIVLGGILVVIFGRYYEQAIREKHNRDVN